MTDVKSIKVLPVTATVANAFVRKTHYSGKVVQNSQLHLGAFSGGLLHGVMQFGPSMRKEFMLDLVTGTGWNQFIELNRMAFDDSLPKNSESRCLGVAIRLFRQRYPHLKWIITFADATQCGDGTIYRASNFLLTGIKKNDGLRRNPKTGEVLQRMAAFHRKIQREFESEWTPIPGYQLRYIYFLDPSWRERLNVPVLSHAAIAESGARMYRGQKA